MGIQPTASKTALLLQCPRPFEESTEIEPEVPGPEAVFGTAVHEILEAFAVAWMGGGEAAVARFPADTPEQKHAWKIFDLLKRERLDKGWKISEAETARAWRPGSSRLTTLDRETHTYKLQPGEMGGSQDVSLVNAHGYVEMLDYKTGSYEDYTDPLTPQNLTLAVMGSVVDYVSILHAPVGGIPVIYTSPVSAKVQTRHAKRLRVALSRIGSGFIRTGPECKYCPARHDCPARRGDIVKEAGKLAKGLEGVNLSETVDAGKFHQLLPRLEKLIEWGRAELKERVQAGEVIERPDGKVLQVKERSRESISLREIEEKVPELGKKLRDLGLVKSTTYDELRAK